MLPQVPQQLTTDGEEIGLPAINGNDVAVVASGYHGGGMANPLPDDTDAPLAAECDLSALPLSFGDGSDPDDNADQLCSPFLTGAELPVLTLASPPDLTPDAPSQPHPSPSTHGSSPLPLKAQAAEPMRQLVHDQTHRWTRISHGWRPSRVLCGRGTS